VSGGVELDRAVNTIHVGERFRRDLGDLTELRESIRQLGLLQPITITPDGTLICGARRLEAVKQLGWDHVKVWIVGNISSRLIEVLAEQNENAARKPLAPTEQARLYDELRTLLAEDAARRQQTTMFTSDRNPRARARCDGPAESAAPSHSAPAGESRRQAAQTITGRNSYTALDQVLAVQHIADDLTLPDDLRELARQQLAAMDEDQKINPHYQTVKAAMRDRQRSAPGRSAQAQGLHEPGLFDPPPIPADLVQAAQDAIRRITTGGDEPAGPETVKQYGVRMLRQTIDDMDGWWRYYNVPQIAADLPDEYFERMRACCVDSTRFIQAIAEARQALNTDA
jgi:ParB family chromosome partitioning protein